MHDPDGPCAHHQDHFSWKDTDRILSPQHAGEWFDHRSRSRIDACVQGHDVSLQNSRRRHTQVFGEPAIQSDANRLEADTQVGVSRHTFAAVAAADVRGDESDLPGPILLDFGTNLLDGAHDLVPGNPEGANWKPAVIAANDAQVRAANACGQHLHQKVPGADRGLGNVLKTQVLGAVIDRRQQSIPSDPAANRHRLRISSRDTGRCSWKERGAARTPATAQRPSVAPTLGSFPVAMHWTKCSNSWT